MVTVALDVDPARARPFVDAAAPTHPSLVDQAHVTDELLGIVNVPMAVWIDESGTLVRPAELAAITESPLKGQPVPEGLPDRMRRMLEEVQRIPGDPRRYRAAVVDWVERGPASPYSLAPDEVVARSVPRGREQAQAAACFELGQHLWRAGEPDAATRWWREAHRLDPANWTYKRQAWTFATTPEGAPPDLIQGATDVYEGNWLDDVIEQGGGGRYYPPSELAGTDRAG